MIKEVAGEESRGSGGGDGHCIVVIVVWFAGTPNELEFGMTVVAGVALATVTRAADVGDVRDEEVTPNEITDPYKSTTANTCCKK